MSKAYLDPIPLVGSHFRPPASTILANLPTGAKLSLLAEPDNPYDPRAVAVHVQVSEVPPSQYDALREALPNFGFTLEELLSEGGLQLGYLCSATNTRQLSKAPPGERWGHNCLASRWPQDAELRWSSNGQALVLVEVQDAEE